MAEVNETSYGYVAQSLYYLVVSTERVGFLTIFFHIAVFTSAYLLVSCVFKKLSWIGPWIVHILRFTLAFYIGFSLLSLLSRFFGLFDTSMLKTYKLMYYDVLMRIGDLGWDPLGFADRIFSFFNVTDEL